jgi:hypothetical protein
MTPPVQAWHANTRQLRKTAAMLFAAAIGFGLFGVMHWFAVVLALAAAGFGAHTLIVAARTGPVLAIGPEGLRYTYFSSRTIPWSQIDQVAVVRSLQRRVAWGKVRYAPSPLTDEITFSLKSYDGYSGRLRNALRGLRTMLGFPGVQCYVSLLDGPTVDDVARAIHAHWPGEIQDLTPVEGRIERKQWTGTPPPQQS